MKLGVTGTRDGFSPEQYEIVREWVREGTIGDVITEFHYGDCVGVDEQMLWLLLEFATPALFIYPARVSEKWRAHTFDKLGGHPRGITVYEALPPKVRNGYIAENCEELWAFPGSGGGTWDCVRKAQALQRQGFIVYRDGKVVPL